jgi:hypothetical protein
MALKEQVRIQLEKKGFFKLYDDHVGDWKKLANDARNLIKPQIKSGEPTVDDIKSILLPLIELHKHFLKFMDDRPKLTQKYWASYFTDYVLHRVYEPTLNIPHEKQVPEKKNGKTAGT